MKFGLQGYFEITLPPQGWGWSCRVNSCEDKWVPQTLWKFWRMGYEIKEILDSLLFTVVLVFDSGEYSFNFQREKGIADDESWSQLTILIRTTDKKLKKNVARSKNKSRWCLARPLVCIDWWCDDKSCHLLFVGVAARKPDDDNGPYRHPKF